MPLPDFPSCHALRIRTKYFEVFKPRHGWWVFRTFDESGMCLLRGLFLGSLQNSLTEEIKAASAIHLPL